MACATYLFYGKGMEGIPAELYRRCSGTEIFFSCVGLWCASMTLAKRTDLLCSLL